jgi:hypothetical protein
MRAPRSALSLSLLSLLVLGTPARAQWQELVKLQLDGFKEQLATMGYVQVQEYHLSSLPDGGTERVPLTLRAGFTYTIVGACDEDCQDMDLTLYDAAGNVLDTDVELDSLPTLEVTPTATATYQLEVSMADCQAPPCYYGIGVFVQGEAGMAGGNNQRFTGTLGEGDSRLSGGEYFDTYTIQVQAGQSIIADLTSSAFDPYLILTSPGNESNANDDWEGSASHSRIEMTADASGTWTVKVTSYEAGETGAYVLTVDLSAATGPAPAGERVESGRLAKGDHTLVSGEFVDIFTLTGHQGEPVVIDLRSEDFDPYLILFFPDGQQSDNDDYEGDAHRSLISMNLPADGEYQVKVTSYAVGETGAYTLRIQQGSAAAATVGSQTRTGALAAGDQTLRDGEYADGYTIEGQPGQHVRIDVSSSEFDTYLILNGPSGFHQENDDVEGAAGHSIIEADLTEAGAYTVIVTSYAAGETGRYELRMELGEARPTGDERRDVRAIALGQSVSGELAEGDGKLETEEFRDIYVFDGTAGESITVELTSEAFDTYVGLVLPSGEAIENDDFEGSASRSRVDLTLRESGRYRIVATSYAAGETGAYRLSLARGTSSGAGPSPAAGGGTVYGVFVGISDYGGRANNLSYTADDARRVSRAMTQGAGMRPENGIILTDAQATADNVRQAIRQMGSRVGPDDVFIFFYSGHGNRVARAGGYQQSDPDAMDETIELYDAGISDDEMNQLLESVKGHISLIVLDSCFSGGFSKDIITVPGRMGLFSSEEDVTSAVAAKFRAGGFLAQFMADAVGEKYADADEDGLISALELSQYLHERYRADVKSGGFGEYVRTEGPQTGYQHLVVDRGSIGPYDIIFR